MDVFFNCMQCQVEDGLPNFSAHRLIRIPDDGVIEATCNRGHHTFTILQQAKFEILSEMAVKAIVDGYYRDAIASFVVSLERLQEFFVQVACRRHGISRETFSKGWKPLSRLSERQAGAFAVAYLIETGEPPKTLSNAQIQLRNDVIHNGKLPDREETIGFAQAVAECAIPVLERLRADAYGEIILELIVERLKDRSRAARAARIRPSTVSMATLFSLASESVQIDVETAVAERAQRPDMAKAIEESQLLGALIDLMRQQGAAANEPSA